MTRRLAGKEAGIDLYYWCDTVGGTRICRQREAGEGGKLGFPSPGCL
jgi:hypothetical protein